MVVTRERAVLICAVAFGAFVLVAVAPGYLFSFQVPQPLLYRLAVGVYTLTLLPAALIGFVSRRACGLWMILVSVLAVAGLWQNEILRYQSRDSLLILVGSLAWWAIVAAIPGIIGIILLKSKRAS